MVVEFSDQHKSQRERQLTRIGLPLVVVAIGVLYFLTMPATITLEDGGIFQMVCHLGGISHPPGYPLFTGLCQSLVFGTSPLAGNLVSFYFALGAVIALYFVVLELSNDALLALFAASAYGLTRCLWSQAIIIEVYSLAAFQFFLCWWLLLKFSRSGRTQYWYGLCFCGGLALSNHWPLFVLSCFGFVSVFWQYRERFLSLLQVRTVFLSLLSVALGLSPYLLLFQSDPAIAMYGEVGLKNFVPYVLREYYDDNHVGSRTVDKLQYLGWLLPLTGSQLGLLAIPLALIGLVEAREKLGNTNTVSVILTYLGSTFILATLLSFRYEPQVKGVFLPYPVIAMGAYAILVALGAAWVVRRLDTVRPAYAYLIMVLLPCSMVLSNYYEVDRSRSKIADEYGRIVLNSLPENALMLVGGDNQIGPIGYLNRVADVRPDVTVQSISGLLFADNMIRQRLPPEDRIQLLRDFKNTTGRRVFAVEQLTPLDVDYGFYYEFEGQGDRRVFVPEIARFSDYLTEVYQAELIVDSHEKVLLHSLIVSLARLYSEEAVLTGVESMDPVSLSRLQRLQTTLPGKMSSLRTMTATNPLSEGLLAFAFSVEDDLDQSIAKQHDALVFEFIARILLARGDKEAAEAYFQKSIVRYPTSQNAALCEYVALSAPPRQLDTLSALKLSASNCLKEDG